MKPASLVIVPVLAAALAACQQPAESNRTAAAQPTPSPVTASAAPLSVAPGDTLPPAPEVIRTAESGAAAAPGEGPGTIDPATGVRIETAPAPGQKPARKGTTARTPSAGERRDGARTSQPEPVDTRPPQPQPQERTADARTDAQRQAPEVTTRVRRSEEPVTLPAGTELPIRLSQTLASDTSRPEQNVAAEITEDVRANGRVALPAGTEVLGHVVVAQQSGRVKGRARLVVAFDEIRLRNRSYPIQAWRWDVTAESSRSRDAKIAGGATAAGAIIGAITGGGKGALKGGIIGGAAGGAAVLATRGNEVELRAGALNKLTLRQSLRIE